MSNVKLGVIGYGNMGSGHIRNVRAGKVPGMEIAAICDISEEKRAKAKNDYPDIPVFATAEEMYKSGVCDSVIIATYHYSHPELAMKAFEYGLNVITEKPAGVYTKQVKEMNEAAEKTDKKFAIMYNQRTNPVYQKVRQMIQRGDLGHIKRITWIITLWYRPQAYHDSSSWRSTWKDEGGGTLINQNPHQLDLWQWMFGMPDKIYATMGFGKYYNIEVEDEVVALMEYNNGTIGQYITTTAEMPGTNRLEVAGDMGNLIVENNKITFKRNIMSEREFNKINKSAFGGLEWWPCEVPTPAHEGEQHVGILKNFVNAVQNGAELIAGGEEGINGLTISNAMHLSAWTGEWVDVTNFPDDKFYDLLQEQIKNSTFKKEENKSVVTNFNDSFAK
ncbi:MAG: Gfo/Idh/MocA family oxidoreductase [Clostridia bacterium]|nr:Gfo/Idh/MocA family oxidoreductase [Clostridia bacterium]